MIVELHTIYIYLQNNKINKKNLLQDVIFISISLVMLLYFYIKIHHYTNNEKINYITFLLMTEYNFCAIAILLTTILLILRFIKFYLNNYNETIETDEQIKTIKESYQNLLLHYSGVLCVNFIFTYDNHSDKLKILKIIFTIVGYGYLIFIFLRNSKIIIELMNELKKRKDIIECGYTPLTEPIIVDEEKNNINNNNNKINIQDDEFF